MHKLLISSAFLLSQISSKLNLLNPINKLYTSPREIKLLDCSSYNFLENLLNDLMVSYINTPTNIFFIKLNIPNIDIAVLLLIRSGLLLVIYGDNISFM